MTGIIAKIVTWVLLVIAVAGVMLALLLLLVSFFVWLSSLVIAGFLDLSKGVR